MSYPQPNSNQYAVNGYDFFRLNTPLASPGDIYESSQSGHAFALGPNSDIANVNIAYFDQQSSTFMNQLTLTADRPMVGLINSNEVGSYAPANRPGRIYIWPNDIWSPDFTIPTPIKNANVNGPNLIREVPQLDIIEYFAPQPGVPGKRPDKVWSYPELFYPATAGGIGGQVILVIPYYGRKFASIQWTSPSDDSATIAVFGMKLEISQQQQQIVPLNGSGNAIQANPFIVQAGQPAHPSDATLPAGGMYDLLIIALTANPAGSPADFSRVYVTVSDTPAPE